MHVRIGRLLRSVAIAMSVLSSVASVVASAAQARDDLCRGTVLELNEPRFERVEIAADAPIGGSVHRFSTGTAADSILIYSESHLALQVGAYSEPARRLQFVPPVKVPAECRSTLLITADIDQGRGDEIIGYRPQDATLLKLALSDDGLSSSCTVWRTLEKSVTPLQLIAPQRGGALYLTTSQRRLLKVGRDGTRAEFAIALGGPLYQERPYAVLSTGDDAPDTLIHCQHDNATCVAMRLSGDATAYSSWTSLPGARIHYGVPLFGDIDDDGFTDGLFNDLTLGGWWSALGERRTAIERPVEGLPSRFDSGVRTVLADLNGDGRADLLALEGASTAHLFASRSSAPLPGVKLRSARDGTLLAVSDAEGHYRFTREPDTEVRVQFPGFDFSPAQIAAGSRCGAIRAERVSTKNASGRALRRAGDDPGPYVCTGYNPGSAAKWGPTDGECPPGYAIVGSDDLAGRWRSPVSIPLRGICCRLPAPDILTGNTAEEHVECPPQTIAVGSRGDRQCHECPKHLLCARINEARYTLGPLIPGTYWGLGRNYRLMKDRVDKEDIPVALRHALGRLDERTWDGDGCVGMPYGSVLTAKAKSCADQRYRQILFNGAQGDPPAGTPVTYFPSCESIADIFDGTTGCAAAETPETGREKANVEP